MTKHFPALVTKLMASSTSTVWRGPQRSRSSTNITRPGYGGQRSTSQKMENSSANRYRKESCASKSLDFVVPLKLARRSPGSDLSGLNRSQIFLMAIKSPPRPVVDRPKAASVSVKDSLLVGGLPDASELTDA